VSLTTIYNNFGVGLNRVDSNDKIDDNCVLLKSGRSLEFSHVFLHVFFILCYLLIFKVEFKKKLFTTTTNIHTNDINITTQTDGGHS